MRGLTVLFTGWVLSGGMAFAQAQPLPPPSTGPFLFFDRSFDEIHVIATGSLRRNGNWASITVGTIYPPEMAEEDGLETHDEELEILCEEKQWRTTRYAFYTETRQLKEAHLNSEDWNPVADENTAAVVAFACQGVRPAGAVMHQTMISGMNAFYAGSSG